MRQLRDNHFAHRDGRLAQCPCGGDVATVQEAALIFDLPREVFQGRARLGTTCPRLRLHRCHMGLQDLQVVKFAKQFLSALDRAHVRGRLLQSAAGGKFQTVTQFFRRNPHRVQSLGRVHLTSLAHRQREMPRSSQQPRCKRLTPRFRRRLVQCSPDGCQPPIELVDLHVFKPLDHRLAFRVALFHDARPHVFDGVARHIGRACQLIQ